MSINGNDTRQDVFLLLVESDDELTPSEIGDDVGETRQAVKYHLDTLVEQGLVVSEGETYRCQPLFTDPEFEAEFVELVAELLPAVSERVQFPEQGVEDEVANIVFNCIQMYFALEMFDKPAQE